MRSVETVHAKEEGHDTHARARFRSCRRGDLAAAGRDGRGGTEDGGRLGRPGFTISLKLDGKKVTKLKAGVPYRFTVTDRSSGHDFHLTGPGVDKVVTGVGFTGTKSVVLKLKKGTYGFVCDPHSSSMRGASRSRDLAHVGRRSNDAPPHDDVQTARRLGPVLIRTLDDARTHGQDHNCMRPGRARDQGGFRGNSR